MPLRVLWEPATQNSFLLLMHFQNAPEAGESKSAQDGGDGLVGDKQGGDRNQKAHGQPNPPTLLPQIVFHLDDSRMADTDGEEYGCADDNSTEVHIY